MTGQTAFDLDIINLVTRHAPRTVGLVMLATYVVLFLLLGSVLLPLKAVIMNLLSISASYGALVWIFQDGPPRRAGSTSRPGPIQTATPLIMFCFVFGLSMDYEVLLLSRVREEYERDGDTAHAVAEALESTGRLITGAAAIMAAVFFGFATARSVIIQAVGIGIGAGGGDRRHHRARAAGARHHAPDGAVELVGARAAGVAPPPPGAGRAQLQCRSRPPIARLRRPR